MTDLYRWRYPNPSPYGLLDYALLQQLLSLPEADLVRILKGQVTAPNGRNTPTIRAPISFVTEMVRSLDIL